jgi:hypothetical protein
MDLQFVDSVRGDFMRAMGWLCVVLAGMLTMAGCANKEEPFKETGAAQKYHDYVPANAQIVAEGTGPLRFTPTTQGTLYLLDLSDMRQVKEMMTPHVVVTGGPMPGSEITFDPATATITRAGKSPLKLTTIVKDHRYQLRWVPANGSE